MCVSRYRFIFSACLAENLSCRKFQESEYTVNDIFLPPKTKRLYYTAAQRYEFYFRVVNYWFLPRENEIHIFKLPCYFLFIIQTSVFAKKNNEKTRNDVINTLTSEDMENTSLESRMQLRMNFTRVLQVAYFPLKHSCLYLIIGINKSSCYESPR